MPQPDRIRSSTATSIVRLALAASLSVIIYGCSTQAPLPPPVQPAPAPPVVEAPHQIGPAKVTTASYYGPEFQGRRTSDGEIYNQEAMTAASRTLPIGSYARVTNLKTGKSVVVRINDHGPFVKGRGIDLSGAAAHELGIDHRGIAKVRVARIEEASGKEGDSWAGDVDVRDTTPGASADYAGSANPPPTPPVTEASVVESPSTVGSWFMELVTPSP